MKVSIIKYNAGNIFSVIKAFHRLGINPILTDDIETIKSSDKVILPGQGAATNTMKSLQEKGLDKVLLDLKQPVLGICIGQQLMCSESEEGKTKCLDLFHTPVLRFKPQKHEDKIPHMGWNNLLNLKSELFNGINENDYVYFVHSYYTPINNYTIATCNYIEPFSAAMNYKNFYSTQFHPEKSGSIGERILHNFLEIQREP